MKLPVAFAACAALAACTSADSAGRASLDRWALDQANPVAAPVDCIEIGRIRGTDARDDRTIDFVMEEGRVMRNRLPNRCVGLAAEGRFTYRTALPRLCSVDTISLLDSAGSTGGSCGLGMFQQVSIPPRPPGLR